MATGRPWAQSLQAPRDKGPPSAGKKSGTSWGLWRPGPSPGGSSYIEDGLLFLDRHGYLEECYFNYAFSPVRDESGGVGGIFCVVTETTEKVLDARRLALLRQLSIRTALDRHVAGAFESIEESLEEYLESLGHDVVVAGDGLEGAACLLELRPDIALVDVGLPGIDGYEVARGI